MAATVYRCNLCVNFQAASLRLLLNHIGRNHKSDPQFHVLCGIDGCVRTYGIDAGNAGDIEQNVELNDNLGDIQDHNNDPEADFAQQQRQLQKRSALCLLHLKEKGRVPQTVVDLVVNNCTEIVQDAANVLKTGVINSLNASGVDFQAIPGLKDLFDNDSSACNPFHGLENERQQHKYYLQNLGLVVSFNIYTHFIKIEQ